MTMASLTLLHIADVHLDAPFRWLGGKGKEQRAQLKETFRAVIDLALQEQVDALLVAGDLFDSNSPSQDTLDLVQTQFRRLNAPVFLLPGTHDCYDESSIYRRLDFSGTRVQVFSDSRVAFEVGDLPLTVHGRANCSKTSSMSPLEGLKRNSGTRFNVALAHGSLAMPGTEHDFPLTPAGINASGMDYVALGHWHSCRDCSTSAVAAYYCGPPELLAEEVPGNPLLVKLSDQGISVEPRPLARRRQRNVELPLDHEQSQEDVRERLLGMRDRDLVLSVALTGIRPLDLVVDAGTLCQELEASFFSFKVVDNSHPSLSSEDFERFPDNLVIGRFVRRMNEVIEGATTPEDKRIRERALQLGVALLQGRKVLR